MAYLQPRLLLDAAFELHHRAADFVANTGFALMVLCWRSRTTSCRSTLRVGGKWPFAAMTMVTEAFGVSRGLLGRGARSSDWVR